MRSKLVYSNALRLVLWSAAPPLRRSDAFALLRLIFDARWFNALGALTLCGSTFHALMLCGSGAFVP